MRRWAPALSALLAVVVAFLGTQQLTQRTLLNAYVAAGSMSPTLERGDRFAVDLSAYRRHPPRVGDIVFYSPNPGNGLSADPDPGDRYISRVLATGGQTIRCCTDGSLVRDGVQLDEPYVRPGTVQEAFCAPGTDPEGCASAPPITVPRGRVFLISDNRNESIDSRYPLRTARLEGRTPAIGVSIDDVHGRVLVTHGAFRTRLLVFSPGIVVALLLGGLVLFGVRREVGRRHGTEIAPAGP